jgi:hypothetical protein
MLEMQQNRQGGRQMRLKTLSFKLGLPQKAPLRQVTQRQGLLVQRVNM